MTAPTMPDASPDSMYGEAVFLLWRLLAKRPDLWRLAIAESYRMHLADAEEKQP